MPTLLINGNPVTAENNDTILKAAQKAGIFIPTLCFHPDLPPRKGGRPVDAVYRGNVRIENHISVSPSEALESGCGLCVVENTITGELVASCITQVVEGMSVNTDSEPVKRRRQEKLGEVLALHPHACLTCAQHEGCPRTQCSSNVPENERCCPQLGNCELQKIAEYVGIGQSTPKWLPTTLPILDDEPLFTRNYHLCIGCTRCVRACREVRGIEAIGFVFDRDGKVRVGSMAPTLKDSGCKFCTACVEVCPTGAIMDKAVKVSDRERDLLPCTAACPAGINIPWYLRLIAGGNADMAYSVIRESVPLPGILGRVCVRPCEAACRRGQVNEPISICALKRFASDHEQGSWKAASFVAPDTGKKVAVVGAGPAGLTTAFYLRKKGHAVTVFDSRPKAGGMMRYGIPRYRLPEAILDKDISEIFSRGVSFQPNTSVGKDISLEELRKHHDAVFIGVGAQLSRKIPIKRADLSQMLWGVDFLREVNLDRGQNLDGKVVVIGGGAVAIDVALTARRMGAKEVRLVCLEDREEMPAHDWEIRDAEDEGVVVHSCWGPLEVVPQDWGVGICFQKCLCVFDSKGTFNPSYDSECTMTLDADVIILAIGQASNLDFATAGGVAVQRGLISVDEKTLHTSVNGVFAGGDAVVFPGAIVHAMGAGRKAASTIDEFLGGNGLIEETLLELPALNPKLGREEGFAYRERAITTKIPVSERTSFQEVDLGFGPADAAREAGRCLQCDLRLAMGTVQLPPEHMMAFTEENIQKVPETEGALRLMDKDAKPIVIKGTKNLRELLVGFLESTPDARFFDFEEDKMFSKRESELIQQHLQKYGQMPNAGNDEDDLF
jgi:formate dehydrogenase (NADP+) beta subunit